MRYIKQAEQIINNGCSEQADEDFYYLSENTQAFCAEVNVFVLYICANRKACHTKCENN
jgi:hypothetical protein